MKDYSLKRTAILLGLSLLLSLAVVRWHGVNNVSYCFYSAGCKGIEEPKGNIKVTAYGYPLTYRQVQSFVPNNRDEKSPDYAGYAETKVESLSFSLPSVIVNTVFWFALLRLLSGLVRPKSRPTLIDRETVERPVAN